MKKNKKGNRILVVIFVTILLIIIGFIITKERNISKPNKENDKNTVILEEENNLDVGDKLQEPKEIQGLEVSNVQINANEEGGATLTVIVKNKTGENSEAKQINITLLDKNNKEIETVNGLVLPMSNEEEIQLNLIVSSNYENIYDYKVKLD